MCETCEQAYRDFNAWLEGQPVEIQELDLLDQIEAYSEEVRD